jgi:hypothetical protein
VYAKRTGGSNPPLSATEASRGTAAFPPSSPFLSSIDCGQILDNNLKHYYVVASLTNAGAPLVGLAGVVVGYQLQVSPGPGAATFGDVPTNHPFFQFVEALAASGITGGCGNGNYCPDNPVTRGQMAVFLSKALGLQWQ